MVPQTNNRTRAGARPGFRRSAILLAGAFLCLWGAGAVQAQQPPAGQPPGQPPQVPPPPTVAELVQRLKHEDARVRLSAVVLLGERGVRVRALPAGATGAEVAARDLRAAGPAIARLAGGA